MAVAERRHIVVVEVVHHTVAERRDKHLARLWVANDKTYRGRRAVGACAQFLVERNESVVFSNRPLPRKDTRYLQFSNLQILLLPHHVRTTDFTIHTAVYPR